MGEVYAAKDTRLGREVALKVLPEELTASPERIRRFAREARALASLNHPSIVTIHSVEEVDGIHFFTMELIEGRPLSALLPSDGLRLEELFAIAVPLSDALSAAHDRGIVHRDLKPANIMLTGDGRVKVLDFGLAKLHTASRFEISDESSTATLTHGGGLVGSVPYVSPEQIKSQEVDERSDIFSLGIILHEMASGRRPFTGSSLMEVLTSILRDPPISLADLRPDLPPGLSRIVETCLAKEPERRFQSARDLRDELQVLQAELASGEVRPGRPDAEQPTRWRPGRRGLLAAVSAFVALVAVAAALFWSQPDDRYPGRTSIAVMPLANLTGNPDQAYLSDGVSAGVITHLGEVSGLRVIGRSETWRLCEQGLDSKAVARRLGVEAVLDGSLQRDGSALRVDLELTDAVSGHVVWSRRFPGSQERLFALQREIARELTRFLSIPLSWKERRRMARDPTRSSRAFDYYLQGQEFLDAVDDPRGPQFAADVFRQALLLDGEFALAHVALSEALWRRYQQDKQVEVLQEAEREARAALEIDPDLPSAQVALARVYRSTGRHAESIAELRQILERHPRPDEAYRELAFSYEEVGDLEAAEQALEASVALRDDHWHRWNSLGAFLQRMGRYAEARDAFEKAAELAPSSITWPYENLAAVRMHEADFEGAIEAYERFGEDTRDPGLASNIATAYFFTGRLGEAEELYRRAVDLAPADPVMRVNLGDVLVRLGRNDEARSEYRAAHRLQQQRLENNPGDNQLRLMGVLAAAKAEECAVAGRLADELEENLPRTAENLHQLAWAHALCGRSRQAIEALRGAMELGISAELLRQEDELRTLRDDPQFRALVGLPERSAEGAQGGLSP